MHAASSRHSLFGLILASSTLLLVWGCPPPGPGGNQAPVAEGQQVAASTDESVEITLVATDADSGSVLTFSIRALPEHGILKDASGAEITTVPYVLPARGRIVSYTPTADFAGPDSFTFSANDGALDSNVATVSVTVGDNEPPADVVIEENTAVAAFRVPAGTITEVRNNAVIRVFSVVEIAGTLRARNSRIEVHVGTNLTVDGLISARQSGDADVDGALPIRQQPAAVMFVIGEGAITFGANSSIETGGPFIVTDDESQLDRSTDEFFVEVENVENDQLDTLVPLPPESTAFPENQPKQPAAASPSTTHACVESKILVAEPVTISGVWPAPGAVPPAGDRPLWIFRFNGERPLNLDGWTVNGTNAPVRPTADSSNTPGQNSTGRDGKNGLNLNIWNNGGPINITGTVTLNLPAGADGTSATAVCASATGGKGGSAGNFRMSAADGIDVSGGTLRINPGRSGSGGAATVTTGAAGAAGCPGDDGDSSTATGGDGADNRKRLFVRGNVAGVENVELGPVVAGDGGEATTDACAGGEGLPCCDGGAGGDATARGGAGGRASLNVGGTGVDASAATVTGGTGGAATATGAVGGEGGDCKFSFGGHGGDGGNAVATGGEGGNAESTGGGAATGGDGGDATSTGGNGGPGGDSGFATPGLGGSGGTATSTAGQGGAGDTSGAAGEQDQTDGAVGAEGGQMEVTIFCFPFDFLVDGTGVLDPGVYEATVFSEEGNAEVGTVDIEFRNTQGAQFATSSVPAPHFGFGNAQVDLRASSLALTNGTAGDIGGIRVTPLNGQGLSQNDPLVVQALDANGEVIDAQEFAAVPSNQANPANGESFDVVFDVTESVVTFRLIAPPGSFVTILEICFLDP